MISTVSTVAALRALTSDTERILSDRLRPAGVTVPQLEFLSYIAANPKCCGADIAEAVHVSPQTGTTVLGNLVGKRLITVKPAPKGRRNTITVTARGAAVITQAQNAVADVEKHLAAALGKDTARSLAGAVTALQPHLPQRGWHSEKSASRAKPKALRDLLGGDRAQAEVLDQRCREWAATVGDGRFVPDHVAGQFGTEAQVDLLVVARRWSPEYNGYHLND